MASVRWVGGAAAVSQVQTFTFAGTWEVGDLIRVTIGSKVWDYAVTSTTIATFLPLFVTAYNALDSSDYPEMAELTAASSSPALTFTADTAGKPFTITLTPLESGGGAADAQTIEGAGTATTGTATTASAGPNDWSTAANWSGSAVPTSSDSVYLENSDDDILYGFAQSAVTLPVFAIAASFTGTIGLPPINSDATDYPEYRARALAISATVLTIGEGAGSGSGRIILDVGSNACTATVRSTGSALDSDRGALQWKGTHASNVLNVLAGDVDVAGLSTETAVVATLRLAGGDVRCGSGTTLTTLTISGGDLDVSSAFTTATMTGGTLACRGSGAATTITCDDGDVYYLSSGTITTLNVSGGGRADFTRDIRTRTITNCNVYAGATILDDRASATWTNGIVLVRCGIEDVTLRLGQNRTLAIS